MPQPLPNIPAQPLTAIPLLEATPGQRDAVAALAHSVADMVQRMPAIAESHRTFDYVDVTTDSGDTFRIRVEVTR